MHGLLGIGKFRSWLRWCSLRLGINWDSFQQRCHLSVDVEFGSPSMWCALSRQWHSDSQDPLILASQTPSLKCSEPMWMRPHGLVIAQLLNHVWLSVTPCSTWGFRVLYHLSDLLKLMSIESMMPSNQLILCQPLLFLPSIFSSISVFSVTRGNPE